MRRLEEVSLQPVRPPASPPSLEQNDPLGLPSYEEAITRSGQHDAPPPPYPGYVLTHVLVYMFTCTSQTSYAQDWLLVSGWNLVLVPVMQRGKLEKKKPRMFAINNQGRKSGGALSLGKLV